MPDQVSNRKTLLQSTSLLEYNISIMCCFRLKINSVCFPLFKKNTKYRFSHSLTIVNSSGRMIAGIKPSNRIPISASNEGPGYRRNQTNLSKSCVLHQIRLKTLPKLYDAVRSRTTYQIEHGKHIQWWFSHI